MGFNYFKDKSAGTSGHLAPVFDAIENGLGNGTIVALDVNSGQIKWKFDTDYPTWVSPAVTGNIVFSGHVTATGKPYKFNNFGAPTNTPLISSGIILALEANTGKKLWEFNVGTPIGIGGPSIGHGMLFVTTGSPAEISANTGGYIVAFGLPINSTEKNNIVNTISNTTTMPNNQSKEEQNTNSSTNVTNINNNNLKTNITNTGLSNQKTFNSYSFKVTKINDHIKLLKLSIKG